MEQEEEITKDGAPTLPPQPAKVSGTISMSMSEIRSTIECLSAMKGANNFTRKRRRKVVVVVANSTAAATHDDDDDDEEEDQQTGGVLLVDDVAVAATTTTATAVTTTTARATTSIHQNDVDIPTKTFLHISRLLLLQLLDKIGPTMAVLRQDVHQNIERLDRIHESNPLIYGNLVSILKKEKNEKTARNTMSCTRALVWLTRSMDFTVALLEKLVNDPGQTMHEAVEDSYNIAFKPWHGWISSAAYKVALKLVPDRNTFMKLLMAEDEDYDTLIQEIKSLISLLLPLLDQIHSIQITFHADRLKSNTKP